MFCFLTVNHSSATVSSLPLLLPETLQSNICIEIITVPQWIWFSCEAHFYVLYLIYQDLFLIKHLSYFHLFYRG